MHQCIVGLVYGTCIMMVHAIYQRASSNCNLISSRRPKIIHIWAWFGPRALSLTNVVWGKGIHCFKWLFSLRKCKQMCFCPIGNKETLIPFAFNKVKCREAVFLPPAGLNHFKPIRLSVPQGSIIVSFMFYWVWVPLPTKHRLCTQGTPNVL